MEAEEEDGVAGLVVEEEELPGERLGSGLCPGGGGK